MRIKFLALLGMMLFSFSASATDITIYNQLSTKITAHIYLNPGILGSCGTTSDFTVPAQGSKNKAYGLCTVASVTATGTIPPGWSDAGQTKLLCIWNDSILSNLGYFPLYIDPSKGCRYGDASYVSFF